MRERLFCILHLFREIETHYSTYQYSSLIGLVFLLVERTLDHIKELQCGGIAKKKKDFHYTKQSREYYLKI